MIINDSIKFQRYWLCLIAITLLCCSACEEFFSPDLGDIPPLLVVDGGITDQPGPYSIKLSFSSGAFSSEQEVVENAIVKIITRGGEEEILGETLPGTYMTSANGIQGTAGESYKISIQLENGKTYESIFQVMQPAILIDSVEAVLETKFISVQSPDVLGYQFYVTTDMAESSDNYFLWSLESTHKYKMDFTIDFLYENYTAVAYPNPTEFMICWRTDQVNEIYTFNTSVLSEPRVERLPLNFARADRRELAIRYSLLVKQWTISKEAYTFWDNIQRQVESQESLYNNQPFQIRGNLFNVDDKEETVLGFFMVASESEKRIFVDPPNGIDQDRTYCFADYMGYGFLSLLPPSSWPVYIYEDNQGDRALSSDSCFDCRELGGSTTEPDFWIE